MRGPACPVVGCRLSEGVSILTGNVRVARIGRSRGIPETLTSDHGRAATGQAPAECVEPLLCR